MKGTIVKKTLLRLLTLSLLASMLCGFAMADVIWEPEDDFYTAHRNECELMNRNFYANGETGFLEVFSKPEGESRGFADNGEVFHVQFTYADKNGGNWGSIEYATSGERLVGRTGDVSNAGWVKMSELLQKYDYISFDEEHGDEYKAYVGDYSELKNIKNIVTWTYPCSGETQGLIQENDENLIIETVYTDASGQDWGFVGYYMGMKNCWICLSDPLNDAIAPAPTATPKLHSPAPNAKPNSESGGNSNFMYTIIFVCIISAGAVSLGFIKALRKNRKGKK
ncbi:MAG: hypothetical protein RSD32_01030 [Oscillospiraceae bacterium]